MLAFPYEKPLCSRSENSMPSLVYNLQTVLSYQEPSAVLQLVLEGHLVGPSLSNGQNIRPYSPHSIQVDEFQTIDAQYRPRTLLMTEVGRQVVERIAVERIAVEEFEL